MKRQIFASKEVSYLAKQSPNKTLRIYSMFPIDRGDCECQKIIFDWKRKMAVMNDSSRKQFTTENPFLECPRSKVGMKRFEITCGNCGDLQGYCWASDASLKDWFDFHYVQWVKDDFWHGCFTPHVSPITQQLCLECCCGQDTRDFRANMTLNERKALMMESNNAIGRDFNKRDSKFTVKKVKGIVVT